MLPIHSVFSGVTRYVTLGFLLPQAGCMAAGIGAEESQSEPQAEAAPLSISPSCKTDDDCQVVADYCTDCSCVALRGNQALPECFGKELSCLLNPCANHVARCVQGGCVADAGELL